MSRYYKIFFTALVITVIAGILFSIYPNFTERFYVAVVYRSIRSIFGPLTSFLRFPLIYVVVPILVLMMIIGLKSRLRLKLKWYLLMAFSISQFVWVVILFQWMWGFNYKRPLPFEAVSKLQQPDTAYLFREAERLITELAVLAEEIDEGILPAEARIQIDKEVRNTLADFDLKTYGRADCEPLLPKGMLYRLQTSGFFMPLSGESYIDGAMLPFQRPYIIAHELCHAYGIGDEGLCNYLGWLACSRSENPYLRYSSTFGYMLYLFADIRKRSPQKFDSFRDRLDEVTKKNLSRRAELADKYPDIFPLLRDMIYGSYLKTQGVSSGLKSYGELVTRIYNWKLKSNERDHVHHVLPLGAEERVFVLCHQPS